VQLHHKFYPKKLASFEIRFLKGTEIEKWCRFADGDNGNGVLTEEQRELELLIGRGQFRNEEFIVAERAGRLIGKLRARWMEGPSSYVLLEPPSVLTEFEFTEVAQELIAYALDTARFNSGIKFVCVALDEQESRYEALQRLHAHLGFVREGRQLVLHLGA
jgi:hypothetical protein